MVSDLSNCGANLQTALMDSNLRANVLRLTELLDEWANHVRTNKPMEITGIDKPLLLRKGNATLNNDGQLGDHLNHIAKDLRNKIPDIDQLEKIETLLAPCGKSIG
jgi:hypothetical protein